MIKVAVYNYREDEIEFFDKFSRKFGLEIVKIDDVPVMETMDLAKGCDCICITTNTMITREMIDRLHELGIVYITTRTIGYEHIDVAYARSVGIEVGNVAYSPNSVADYAIMMMLMVLRKAKNIMYRHLGQDYAMYGNRGRDITDQTVGIIGTGKIGQTVAKHLSGFGCKILAYDIFEKEELKQYVTYVSLDQLYEESDIITLHVPADQNNIHMIRESSIRKMKDGVILINTARGALIRSEDLIAALESGKVWGAGLDVVDGDREIYYRDQKYVTLSHRELAILNGMPNVLMLPHMAFFTDQAVSDMVEYSLESCMLQCTGKENRWLVK